MRILVINRWVGHREGGNEVHTRDIIRLLLAHDHDVDLITTGSRLDGLHPRLRVIDVGGTTEYYAFVRFAILHALLFLGRALWTVLRERARGTKYDLVSVYFSLEAMLARVLRVMFGYRYIMTLEGDTDLEMMEGRRADLALVLSNRMLDEAQLRGYAPIVLPKGVDQDRFNVAVDGRAERDRWLGDATYLVLAVGRLDARKDYGTLVRAIHRLRHESLAVRAVIIGEGEQRTHLAALITELGLEHAVLLGGELANESDQLPRLYRAADAFAHPSLYEGFGYVFMEAMSCGIPIVCTNTSVMPEVVGDAGVMVPPSDDAAFAAALKRVLTDVAERERLGALGLERVKQWTWAELTPRYLEAYARVGSAPRPAFLVRLWQFAAGLATDTPRAIRSLAPRALSWQRRRELWWAPTRDRPSSEDSMP